MDEQAGERARHLTVGLDLDFVTSYRWLGLGLLLCTFLAYSLDEQAGERARDTRLSLSVFRCLAENDERG